MRSAMRAACQLPGRGPTDVDDAPTPAINQKSDDENMMTPPPPPPKPQHRALWVISYQREDLQWPTIY